MDLSLTDEQRMLKQTAEEFLRRELPKQRVRDLFESDTGFAPDIWERMGRLGWTGMVIPREYGGQGQDFATLGVLYEELGASLCPSPHLSSAVLAALTLLEMGSDAQKRSLLPSIARGERILAFAFTESDYGWSPDKVHVQASRRNDIFTISGTKLFVPDAHVAEQLIVVARTRRGSGPQGLTAFLVDARAPGVTTRTLSGWLGDKLNEVTLENVRVPTAAVIGAVDGAWSPLERVLDRATAALCAYMVGGCRRVLEMSVEYSQHRIAFGVPIGTFQRVQDWLIEAVNIEQAARWTTYEALWKLDQGRDDAPLSVSMAKAVCSDGYFKAAEAAHHVHAGVGIDMNYGLAYYTQKARTLQHYLGDAVYHRERIAELLKV